MKKIIAAFDGFDYSTSTARYAIQLCKECNAHLVGVFLDDVTYHSYKLSEITGNGGIRTEKWDMLEAGDKEKREEAASNFEHACQQAKIEYSIHHNKYVAIHELLHESIYADLLIVNKTESFSAYDEKTPTFFMHELLSNVQCPVLVTPLTYNPIEKIVLLYDGSPASVFAIQSFSSLFSSLKRLPVEVLTVKNHKHNLHLPDNKLMKEFMKRHFPEAKYMITSGNADDQILAYLLKQHENTLLVLGAYQRSKMSRWFKASTADTLMENSSVPLFIAHK
ncbi:Universal stress protein family protein [Filimonas lacunae]|uniref:Universal stress protein family protein n=1 Tax=Filimonas lacunae TaxID=477680 RepID=A0A1N7NKJ2_9BACT|nr:universal stress protein [Filimonas lacunae]SIS98699.1 Universal stress protein family protein [Filimonas lacunae]